jgi:hypothetical protein
MPAKVEIRNIYAVKETISNTLTAIAQSYDCSMFTEADYWSSTEYDYNSAFKFTWRKDKGYFNSSYGEDKWGSGRVRAVINSK